MAQIKITTFIKNTPAVVFDLSRSIDLHKLSTAKTNEEAVAGVTSGLISLNETVTWQAFHLFKLRQFTSRITEYDFPHSFTDQMQKGDLKYFRHEHLFSGKEGGTLMEDRIDLEAPCGLLGKLVMKIFLKNYFKRFLIERNTLIKEFAESNKWKAILKQQ
ncbi:MAG: SRPBCC family protein [Ferruginibacter sp.]